MNLQIQSVLLALVSFLFCFSDASPQQTNNSFSHETLKGSETFECESECPPESPNRYNSSQIYIFGGVDENNKFSSSASSFNSSTSEWKKTTKMSATKYVSAGVAVGSKIYLFGGYSGDTNTYFETAEVYDCETGTYSQYRSMPEARHGPAAAVLNGYIYVAGGWDGSKVLSSVIRYNIQTTRLETVSSMNAARDGLQLIESGGLLYAICGNNARKLVEVYDPNTDRWSKVSCTNLEHEYFGATAHEGKIYVCSNNGFEMYDPDTDEWTILTPPSKNYRGKSLVSMNGQLWALGGETSPHNGIGTKSVFTYNFATNKWSQRPDMDAARVHHTALVVNH